MAERTRADTTISLEDSNCELILGSTTSSTSKYTSPSQITSAQKQHYATQHPTGKKRKKASKASSFVLRWAHNFALQFVGHRFFDNLILLVIFANTFQMATVDPLFPTPPHHALYEKLFLSIFIFEMLIKMFALGFTGYFKSRWYWLDFVVVVSAIADVIYSSLTTSDGENSLVVLRVIRVLRPLKTVSSLPKLAQMIEALQNAFVPMAKAMSLMTVFIFLMSVFATNFFMVSFNSVSGSRY